MSKQIKINVYRDGGTWFGARWIDGEYDGCDSLEISDDASEAEAIEAAQQMSLTVTGERIVRKIEDLMPAEIIRHGSFGPIVWNTASGETRMATQDDLDNLVVGDDLTEEEESEIEE